MLAHAAHRSLDEGVKRRGDIVARRFCRWGCLRYLGRRIALGFASNGANNCTVKSPDVTCGNGSLRYAPRVEVTYRS
jgi:hypothetical protein